MRCCPCALTAGCAHWFCESSELGDAVNSFIPAAAGTSDRVDVDLEFCASALLVALFFFLRAADEGAQLFVLIPLAFILHFGSHIE